jgi:hypothetical protein
MLTRLEVLSVAADVIEKATRKAAIEDVKATLRSIATEAVRSRRPPVSTVTNSDRDLPDPNSVATGQ